MVGADNLFLLIGRPCAAETGKLCLDEGVGAFVNMPGCIIFPVETTRHLVI